MIVVCSRWCNVVLSSHACPQWSVSTYYYNITCMRPFLFPCRAGPSDEVCSELGVCECMECNCLQDENNPSKVICGKYCHCHNQMCPTFEGLICGGEFGDCSGGLDLSCKKYYQINIDTITTDNWFYVEALLIFGKTARFFVILSSSSFLCPRNLSNNNCSLPSADLRLRDHRNFEEVLLITPPLSNCRISVRTQLNLVKMKLFVLTKSAWLSW